jgi:hypothetical protein
MNNKNIWSSLVFQATLWCLPLLLQSPSTSLITYHLMLQLLSVKHLIRVSVFRHWWVTAKTRASLRSRLLSLFLWSWLSVSSLHDENDEVRQLPYLVKHLSFYSNHFGQVLMRLSTFTIVSLLVLLQSPVFDCYGYIRAISITRLPTSLQLNRIFCDMDELTSSSIGEDSQESLILTVNESDNRCKHIRNILKLNVGDTLKGRNH